MGYIVDSLSDGEEIVAVFRPHWVNLVPAILLGLTVVALPYALYLFLRWRCLEQGVTTRRAIRKTGIIGRSTEEMLLASVETIDIRQTVPGRLLDYGDVLLTGRGTSTLVFPAIDGPLHVKSRLQSALLRRQTP